MNNIFCRICKVVSRHYWTYLSAVVSKTKNVIVLESSPDLSDNTKAVFDEMMRRKMNKKYKLVWLLFDSDISLKSMLPNVLYIPHWEARAKYYRKVAKCFVFCNRILEEGPKDQVSIYLSHGTSLKTVRKYYTLPKWVDWAVAASPALRESHARELNFNLEHMVGLGYPRNDILTQPPRDIGGVLNTTCKTILVWYPTFRQMRGVSYETGKDAIPLIHTAEDGKLLNDVAIDCNTLIVIKPHPAQNMDYIKNFNFSNIRFIDEAFYTEHKITSYEFIAACDGLITDYSSVYYDYTLCDKPVALVWEDVDVFTEKHLLIEDYEYRTQGGEKIYTMEDFVDFIKRVSLGIDLLQEERREIMGYANASYDGNYQTASKVLDFIVEKANL